MNPLLEMVVAIRSNSELSKWFEGLESLSTAEREVEVLRMRAELLRRDEDGIEDIVIPMSLLVDEGMFAAALRAFRLK